MGNTLTTNLDIAHLFEEKIDKNKEKLTQFNVSLELECYDDPVCVRCTEINELRVESNDTNAIYWKPKTHMRDFEVLFDDKNEKITISRGAGIGVIIHEPSGTYLKLMYQYIDSDNGEENFDIVPAEFHTQWERSSYFKQRMNQDLGIGYDILFIAYNGEVIYLNEQKDERDYEETPIFIKGLESHANFKLPAKNKE